jgi:hypothetical protein
MQHAREVAPNAAIGLGQIGQQQREFLGGFEVDLHHRRRTR